MDSPSFAVLALGKEVRDEVLDFTSSARSFHCFCV